MENQINCKKLLQCCITTLVNENSCRIKYINHPKIGNMPTVTRSVTKFERDRNNILINTIMFCKGGLGMQCFKCGDFKIGIN